MTPEKATIKTTNRVNKVVSDMNSAIREYKNKFGGNSLDRVMIPDIVHDDLEALLNFTRQLWMAVSLSEAIPQIDEKAFTKIIR